MEQRINYGCDVVQIFISLTQLQVKSKIPGSKQNSVKFQFIKDIFIFVVCVVQSNNRCHFFSVWFRTITDKLLILYQLTLPVIFSNVELQMLIIGPGGMRAPCVLACAMRSLAIVITIVQSFSFSRA